MSGRMLYGARTTVPPPHSVDPLGPPDRSGATAVPIGRERELAAVERLLRDISGEPTALVLLGDAGIGKTTVWRTGLDLAAALGISVLRAQPAEAERDLSYAALDDLLRAVPRQSVEALPEPQRRALRAVTMEEEPTGRAIDPRTVAAGLLGVVRQLATARPVLLAVDDVQWLDDPSRGAIEFAARRLERLPVAILLTLRGDETGPMPLGLDRALPPGRIDRLTLGPLSLAALYQLLYARLGQRFPRPTLLRIAELSGGNALLAIEMGRAIVASGRPLQPGQPLPIGGDLAAAFDRRLASLDRAERRCLLVAASAPRPTPALVAAACRRLGWRARLPRDADILDARDPTVIRFGHPLVAVAALAAGSTEERRAVHRALADLAEDAATRARHLALAVAGPDREVAAALEEAGRDTTRRGAPEAGIELCELACRLTPEADAVDLVRRRRILAELLLWSGETDRARETLETAIGAGPPGPERALAMTVLAHLAFQREGGSAVDELCAAALVEAGPDPVVRGRIELAWSSSSPDATAELAHAQAAIALLSDGPPGLRAGALTNFVVAQAILGHSPPMDLLDEAVDLERMEPAREIWLGAAATRAWVYHHTDRLVRAHAEFESLAQEAEERGDEGSLARILVELAQIDLRSGRWDELPVHAAEAVQVAERAGREHDRAMALLQLGALAAARGDRATAEPLLDELGAYAERTNEPFVGAAVAGNRGALALADGDVAAAERWLAESVRRFGAMDLGLSRYFADRLEALAGVGRLETAGEIADELEEQARRAGRPRPLALVARGRAHIAAARGDLAAALEAADRSCRTLEQLGMSFEAARSLLLRGVIHRRRREKRLAHEDLSAALATFAGLGASAWAERARQELDRIGLRPHAPRELTDTERTVARLAAEGRTNREIAALAFMSARTVEGVLARTYAKLGVGSRAELGRVAARWEAEGRRPD